MSFFIEFPQQSWYYRYPYFVGDNTEALEKLSSWAIVTYCSFTLEALGSSSMLHNTVN